MKFMQQRKKADEIARNLDNIYIYNNYNIYALKIYENLKLRLNVPTQQPHAQIFTC